MAQSRRLGAKVRALRRKQGLRQARLAQMLGISPSYLNLIEHDRRPLSTTLLLRLTELFDLDLKTFAADSDARLATDLMEVFGDPAFEDHRINPVEIRDLAIGSPPIARAVLLLYQRYRSARDSALGLAAKISEDPSFPGVDYSRLPTEEVSDFLQSRQNHFPELEEAAERLWSEAGLRPDDMYHGLSGYLSDALGIRIAYVDPAQDRGAVRRFLADSTTLVLSESLPRASRKFQIAHQIALARHSDLLDRIASGGEGSTPESTALCRIALANYFAGAVVMPYDRCIAAARETRYDLDLMGNRFGASFEQVCHRLTTLRRPGNEGIPFHFVRTDIAGNVSKRFSASGIRISRFGACPRWNLHSAFLTPGHISTQVSVTPDGVHYFCIARTVEKGARGHGAPQAVLAITLGCEVRHARQMVYADGIDLDNLESAVPIGTTCRLCERMDCRQRAVPPLQHPLRVDERVRGISFYAPPVEVAG